MERGDAKVNTVRAINDVDKSVNTIKANRTTTRGLSLKSMHSRIKTHTSIANIVLST